MHKFVASEPGETGLINIDAMDALVFGSATSSSGLVMELLRKRHHEAVATDNLETARELFDRHRPRMVFLNGIDTDTLKLTRFIRRLEGDRVVVVGLIPDSEPDALANALSASLDDTIVFRGDDKEVDLRLAAVERRAERRRRAEDLQQQLRESETRYRLLAEHSTDMISRHDAEGRYLYASPACRKLLGYEPSELIGRAAYDFFHVDDLTAVRKSHNMVLDHPGVNSVTYRIRKKDGEYIWFETTSRSIRNEVTGDIESIIAVSRDVSVGRDVQEEMSRYRGELARTQRLGHIGTWYWDASSNRLGWTDEVFSILGHKPNAFAPSLAALLEFVHPEDVDRVGELLNPDVETDGAVEAGFRIRRANGETRFVHGRAELANGQVAGVTVVGILQDVTELAVTEEALEAREKQYQAILETTVDGIITIDEEGRIQSFNSAAEEIFGYQSDEVLEQNIKVLMPEYYAAEHDSYIKSYLDTGHRKIIGIGREVVGRRKNGDTFPMDLAVSEVDLGNRRLFSGIVRDVSERRQLEQQILRISEQERQRIGQDLHDGLGQMLTGIGLIAKNITNRLEAKELEEATDMREITNLIGEADEFARSLARGLIPVELDAGGLSAAFHRLATNAQRLFDLDCTFEEVGGLPNIENTIATHLYRIAQEGLSNAVRHGQASQVR
ncbi:MAG: PAS domain S-box protein, partial [Rhodothermia bacterium]|nr:PAS domain S-box protein [Rhodothermia bacterium]